MANDKELKISITSDFKAQGFNDANKNLNGLTSNFGSLQSKTDNLKNSFIGIKSVVTTIVFSTVVKEIIDLADSYKLIESRISLVTKNTNEFELAQQSIFDISQKTRIGFKETADLYSRIAISTKDYNLSQEELLGITSTINKAMIVSGGTAESMNSATIQLGQAFSGNFQSVGQELQSIREQTPALYQAIVAGTGMTSQAFKKAAEDGELSSEIIIKALEKSANKVDIDFEKISKTIGSSMTVMSNSIVSFIGYVEESTGVFSSLANGIISTSKELDSFTLSLKSSNNELSSLITKGNIKLEEDGILSSILKVNKGVGNALYSVLSETLGVVDQTAGEWSKIIDSSYNGMGKWVESVGLSLGIVEEKAKATKKTIDSIVPSRPTNDRSYTLVDDLNDRFSRSTELTKEQQEELYNLQKKQHEDGIKLAESKATALIKINDEINKNSFTAYEYGLTLIEKEVAEYQKLNIQKSKIDEYVFNAKMELGIKQLEQETKDAEAREKEVKAQYDKEQDAMLGYYKAVGMESDAFYLEEVMKLQKLADAGILSNSQMLEVWTKDNEKFQDEQFKKSHEWLYDFFDNMDKALDNKLLDGFKTRFKNFGSWLKDLFSSIGDSIFASLSRTLAGSITSSLQGGIVNTFKSYSGFGSASLVGTSLSASDISSIAGLSGSTVTDGMIKTSGGTLIDQASGTVTAQGSDAMSILSTASSVKSAYGLLTNGVSGAILDGFTGLAGLTGIGALTEFGVGFASPFTAGLASTSPLAGVYGSGIAAAPSALTSAGAMAGGALLGGAVGYGVGSLGDMLFGAQTKAGIGGAIGGATGGLLASLGVVGGLPGIIGGALLGSILGGFFGSTKKTGAGIDILGNASADSANGQYWQSYKKKSWFSSSSWTNTTGFGEAENQAIMQTIGIYDTLLSQLGEYNDLIVVGGRFSNLQEFLDGNVVKSFLTAINPQNLDEIYKSWTDYAAKIDSTITEALATAVSGYTTYGRGFTEWKLGSGTTEQLKFTAEYLQKDFTALASSLGANGVTVDNFLAKYDEAIKANFTQDTITAWASLGDTLMKSTDATVKYKEALDQLNGTTTYSLPVDTMLAKVNNSSSTIDIKQLVTTQTNQNDSVIGLLVQSVKALQEILRVSQFGKTIV